MIEFFSTGGFMMWPLLALAAGVAWLTVRTVRRLRTGRDPEAVRRGLHGILFWGTMAVVLGMLGTVVGLVSMTEAIAQAGSVSPALVWGGVGVSLVTLIFGLVIFVVSAIAWFALRQWHAATTAALVAVLAPFIVSGALLAALAAPASAQTPQWQVSEERRIGPPSAEFGSITGVALDGLGRLWIADGMAGALYVEEDEQIRRVARPGEGPGELAPGAIEIVPLPGDSMLVVELQTRRLHRFAADGAFVRSSRIGGEDGMTGQWQRIPGGGLAARVYPASVTEPGASPEEGDPVRAFDLDGRAGDVLAMLPPTESFRMGEGPLPVITVLAPQPLWSIDPQGRVLVGSTHAYEVRAVEPDGSAATVVSEPVDPGPIGGDLERKARELLRETMMERRMPPPMVDQIVEAAAVADRAPVLGGILAGPDGTIWLQQAAVTGAELLDLEQPGDGSWRIYDAQGAQVGTVSLPAGVRLLGWQGDRLVGIALNELGETSAVVYKVEAARAPLRGSSGS